MLAALERAFQDLKLQDQLLLRMLFFDGKTVATASRVLGEKGSVLYRRRIRLLEILRKRLEAEGFDADTLRRLLNDRREDPDNDDDEGNGSGGGGNTDGGPSL